MRQTLIITAAAALAAAGATAEPTHIDLRAVSSGAKFIGTSMGGVRFTLEDVQTGEVLATGVATGSTGDTEALMHGQRNTPVASGAASVWTATLDIEEPRLVRAVAYGPLAQPQSARQVTAEQWIVPGRDLTGGDGWVVEMPGLVVDAMTPAAHTVLDKETETVEVAANVTMMCGCPIEPGGVWDAAEFNVAARVSHEGELLRTVPLEPMGEPSRFAADIAVDQPGVYGLTVVAHQPSNGNTGLDRTTVILPGQ
jgi:hypothetical protein